MIGFVRGELCEIRPGKLVIDVNGIGVNVLVAETMIEELPSIGNEVKIYTYMSVREDGMSLYGFLTHDALDLFEMLISVNGVGPKGAQAILGFYSVADIKFYIVTEDVSHLSKAPTVGKKTAERIVLELKDKVNKEEIALRELQTNLNKDVITPEVNDAIEALVALGYDKKAAKEAVLMIDHVEELDSNTILKLALPYMYS